MEVVSESQVDGSTTNQIRGVRHAVYILVILCIVSVANVLANRYNKSYDSTSNKRYSLSDQTAKIVKGLTQPVTITYFDKTSRFPDRQGFAGPLRDAFAQGASRIRRSGQESPGRARRRRHQVRHDGGADRREKRRSQEHDRRRRHRRDHSRSQKQHAQRLLR